MVTYDDNLSGRNPVAELHAAQRRRRWIAYVVVLTSTTAILLILRAILF